MNNQQFRKLMLASSEGSSGSKDGSSHSTGVSSGATLGSRQRLGIPMTPRAVAGAQNDFARQLAERKQALQPQKKFKSSAPKGTKYEGEYVDRIHERHDETSDDRAERLKALEESLKKEEINQETYDKLRFQIAGGDLGSTHLVKGLDFALLKRVREGEDVYGNTKVEAKAAEGHDQADTPLPDIDDEFDQLEQQDVQVVVKDDAQKKKGQYSTVSLVAGKKRSRHQILAELKASREAAKAQQESSLGGRFRKIGVEQTPSASTKRDENRNRKKEPRKRQPDADANEGPKTGLLMPDKDAKPLGMEIPEQYREKETTLSGNDGDINIFDDVGDDYNPLADLSGSDTDSEVGKTKHDANDTHSEKPPEESKAPTPRNYFQDSKTALVSVELAKGPVVSHADVMAAINREAAIRRAKPNNDEGGTDQRDSEETKAHKERLQKMLQNENRDYEDMDLGFGTSRFEDEEDFDESKVKLSTWGDEDNAREGGRSKGEQKRKRGPKRRKGDVNNAADVLRVMEQQRKKQ